MWSEDIRLHGEWPSGCSSKHSKVKRWTALGNLFSNYQDITGDITPGTVLVHTLHSSCKQTFSNSIFYIYKENMIQKTLFDFYISIHWNNLRDVLISKFINYFKTSPNIRKMVADWRLCSRTRLTNHPATKDRYIALCLGTGRSSHH